MSDTKSSTRVRFGRDGIFSLEVIVENGEVVPDFANTEKDSVRDGRLSSGWTRAWVKTAWREIGRQRAKVSVIASRDDVENEIGVNINSTLNLRGNFVVMYNIVDTGGVTVPLDFWNKIKAKTAANKARKETAECPGTSGT